MINTELAKMKTCSYVIFTGMSKAEFGQSVHHVNSLLVTEDKQSSLRWKNEYTALVSTDLL